MLGYANRGKKGGVHELYSQLIEQRRWGFSAYTPGVHQSKLGQWASALPPRRPVWPSHWPGLTP